MDVARALGHGVPVLFLDVPNHAVLKISGQSHSSERSTSHVAAPMSHAYVVMVVSQHLKGCCRIKYIGRNCRVVLVGGILLKADQEVPAGPGTKVILNFNNKVPSTYMVSTRSGCSAATYDTTNIPSSLRAFPSLHVYRQCRIIRRGGHCCRTDSRVSYIPWLWPTAHDAKGPA